MSAMGKLNGHSYDAKIAECYALCEAVDDLLAQAVYHAMAREFEARAASERAKSGMLPFSMAAPSVAALRMARQAR
jgi:hypothetical protein